MRPAADRRWYVPALVATVVALLAGCSGTDDVPDLDQVRQEVTAGVDRARQSLGDLEDVVSQAGELGADARGRIAAATTTASDAVDQARRAVEDAGASAGPQAERARADAEAALESARAELDAAAAGAEGSVKAGLESLSAQIDRLAQELDAA